MSDRKPSSRRTDRQSGMTLIEIMITLVVLSILVLGISGLWANVTGDFLALTTRQKAIFVLHGEMARLATLFRYNERNLINFVENNSGNYVFAPPTRDVYPDNEFRAESTGTKFDCGDRKCAGSVLHIENAVAGQLRNYVWIDQARNIVGELSWRFLDSTMPENAQNCSGTPCRELTVYLNFPHRYIDDKTTPKTPEFGRVETLSLITIVGQRP